MKCENCQELLKEQIEPIINSFNFDKVQRVMEFVGWKWYDGQPSKEMLIKVARQILNETVDKNLNGVSTGGLKAEKHTDEYDNPYLELTFVLEHQDGEYGFDE